MGNAGGGTQEKPASGRDRTAQWMRTRAQGDAADRTCAHPTRGGLPWARQAAATAPPIPPPRRAASLWKKVPHTSNMGPTARAARPPPRTPPYTPMLPRPPVPSRQRALKKTAPQPMVRAHIKWPTAAAAERTRGASSPAHAAYTPMMPLLCRVLQSSVPLAPAGAEKVHAAADGSGAYQMTDRRRSGKRARRVLPRARRHTCRCCRRLPAPSRQRALKKTAADGSGAYQMMPTAAARKARAARPPPRTPPYMPMMPPPSGPFAPAGAEKDRRGRFGHISNG